MENQLLKENKDEIFNLWQGGKSAQEIADIFGSTRNSVMGFIWRLKKKGAQLRGSSKRLPRVKRDAQKKVSPVMVIKSPKPVSNFVEKIFPTIECKKLQIHELELSSCRYIVTNDGEPVRYCGNTISNRSYCKDHALRCYIPLSKPTAPKKKQL